MIATFGKLEHQTLTLEPGLNVIHAPNEWGKSTWCAFLVAMLYGIDTRERTKQGMIADKERYAPWSGSPMSGRIDLCWKGRDITIERSTRGRSIFGQFNAYETATGLAVPELTAANCGQQLLGVEKTVFTRAGFIRHSDLPVTDDDALRRRLNALVTTGDESGASDDLGMKLKALKNRCRHNRTGLLPQAEAQREELQGKLGQLEQLRQQRRDIATQLEQLDIRYKELENHQQALAYQQARSNAQRVEAAEAACEQAQQRYALLAAQCSDLPDTETAQSQIMHLEQLQLQQEALLEEALPPAPQPPIAPECFSGMTPQQALQQTQSDRSAYRMLEKPLSSLFWILPTICIAAAIGLLVLADWKLALIALMPGLFVVGLWLQNRKKQKQDRLAIAAKYPHNDPDSWVTAAESWQKETEAYENALADYRRRQAELDSRKAALGENIQVCTGGLSISQALDSWRQTIETRRQLNESLQAWEQTKHHTEALRAMVKPVAAPAMPDLLTLTEDQTRQALADVLGRQRQLRHLEGQLAGKMEALGQEAPLLQQLKAVQNRIDALENVFEATTLAMEVLEQAANMLQRRFAPRISQRAQTLFTGLTQGRYDRLVLDASLNLQAGACDEDVLRDHLWRSDGTADQLYLALRLAVAEELTPEAPLVLDDALVRFDDDRMALAMGILKEAARDKQVILFTCQNRETKHL